MNIDKEIENLKEITDLVKEEIKNNDENTTAILDITDLKSLDTVLSELEELREDNYTYHQLMRMQNEREYRSKFLKDFKKEYGENVMPDYDEIYKRYDKQKKELEKKDKELETYKKIAEKLAHYIWQYDCCEYEIGKNGKCEGYYIDKDCTEKCIIDWARKEVEKDE